MGATEEEVAQTLAQTLMEHVQTHGYPDAPPALAVDGKGGYREALVTTEISTEN